MNTAMSSRIGISSPNRVLSQSHIIKSLLSTRAFSSTSRIYRPLSSQELPSTKGNQNPSFNPPPSTSTSTSSSSTSSPRDWSNAEPLHPEHLVNHNGRILSTRIPPDPPEQERSLPFTPQPPSIWRALLFFSFVSISSYSVATYWAIKDSDRIAQEISQSRFSNFGSLSSFFGGGGSGDAASSIGERKLRVAKQQEIAERLGWRMEWVTGWCDQLGIGTGPKEFVGTVYLALAERYLALPPSQQAIVPIIALNTLVFIAWRAPGKAAYQFLSCHFIHSPASGRHYPMLTSVFSHQSPLHFLFNHYAFWSFGAMAFISPLFIKSSSRSSGNRIPEASITPHFLAFFATAGVFASLVSHTVVALRFRRVSLLKGLEFAKKTVGRHSGLGASGAIYAAIVATGLGFPDSRLSIIILPFISFPVGTGISCMVALDLIGAIRGWRMFDHFAHLGGAFFGFIYFKFGYQWWEDCKRLGRRIKDESLRSKKVVEA